MQMLTRLLAGVDADLNLNILQRNNAALEDAFLHGLNALPLLSWTGFRPPALVVVQADFQAQFPFSRLTVGADGVRAFLVCGESGFYAPFESRLEKLNFPQVFSGLCL